MITGPNDARTVCETDANHFQQAGSILPCKDWAAADPSYGFPAGHVAAQEVSSGKFKYTCP